MTFTTVPVKPDTLARLRAYKTGGKTYDDVLNDLMDERPPEEFIRWHLEQVASAPRIPWEEVRKELGGARDTKERRTHASRPKGPRKPATSRGGKVPRADRPARGRR